MTSSRSRMICCGSLTSGKDGTHSVSAQRQISASPWNDDGGLVPSTYVSQRQEASGGIQRAGWWTLSCCDLHDQMIQSGWSHGICCFPDLDFW